MATELYRLGVPVGVCYEELNVTGEDVVTSVHRSYRAAGALLIESNTFGASRAGLARYGLEDQVARINRAGVRLARAAAGEEAYVAGTVGSVRGMRPTFGVTDELVGIYAGQIAELLMEGPDCLLFETFYDLEELRAAVQAARGMTDIPVIAQLALVDLAVTRDGALLGDAFTRLIGDGATVVGLNCRMGPADMERALARAALEPSMLLSALPNAGLLSVTDGHYAYAAQPEYFGRAARVFRDLGVRIVGGCCGTTPDHIREMANAVQGLAPLLPEAAAGARAAALEVKGGAPAAVSKPSEVVSKPSEVVSRPSEVVSRPSAAVAGVPTAAVAPFAQPAYVHEKARGERTVIVELDPPKELESAEFLAGARALRDAGADAVTMADNSLAIMRMSNMALGALMKQSGVEPLLHIACRDRNLIGQQSHLLGLHALGIHQVLVVTGDPSRFGDFPGASSVYDLTSFDMIRMVKQLNEGLAFSGRVLADRARFAVGAAFNPHVRHLDKAVARLERKVLAGADFIMTQPIFDPAMFAVLDDATRHIPAPVFVGVMPLLSSRNAEFLHNEVPGIRLTDEARARMAQFKGARAREEGVALARELVAAAAERFNGIYLITPMMRYEMTVELTEYARGFPARGSDTGGRPAQKDGLQE